MSSGQPSLKVRRPAAKTAPEAALERLEKIDAWTEQPTLNALAEMQGGAGEGATPRNDAPTSVESPAPVPVVEPWRIYIKGTDSTTSMNFKLPSTLAARLKWLGDTQPQENMHTILIRALEHELKKMERERKKQ